MPSMTIAWTRYSSYPLRRAESVTSARSGGRSLVRSSGVSPRSPPRVWLPWVTAVMMTGNASPIAPGEELMISLHARAMIAPPEYASVLTHAMVLLMDEDLIVLVMSRTAPTPPPGELISKTIALYPASSASPIRLRTLIAVIASMAPSMVMIATRSACREAGTDRGADVCASDMDARRTAAMRSIDRSEVGMF